MHALRGVSVMNDDPRFIVLRTEAVEALHMAADRGWIPLNDFEGHVTALLDLETYTTEEEIISYLLGVVTQDEPGGHRAHDHYHALLIERGIIEDAVGHPD